MRVDRIGVLFRRERGGKHDNEEDYVDEYMEQKSSRANPFTAADKDDIASNIEYILQISGYGTQGEHDEAIAELLHLCEVWMGISVERTKRGLEGLARHEWDIAHLGRPRRDLNQVELAALSLLAGDQGRPAAGAQRNGA